MMYYLLHAPIHVISARLLPHLAIHPGHVMQRLWIRNESWCDNHGSDGSKAIEGLCIAELTAADSWKLKVSCRNIVPCRVTKYNVFEREFRWEVLAVAGDDHGQLAFIVEHRLATRMDGDRSIRANKRVGRFHEDNWILRYSELERMQFWSAQDVQKLCCGHPIRHSLQCYQRPMSSRRFARGN